MIENESGVQIDGTREAIVYSPLVWLQLKVGSLLMFCKRSATYFVRFRLSLCAVQKSWFREAVLGHGQSLVGLCRGHVEAFYVDDISTRMMFE